MKRFLRFIFIAVFLLTISMQVFASDGIKFHATMCTNFNPEADIRNIIQFKPLCNFEYDNHAYSQESVIHAKVESTQDAKRFHKSGFVTFQIVGYSTSNNYTDLSSDNLYGIARKYEKVEGIEAAKTGAELTATTVAGFIFPGSDIVYYFTKGAIKNDNGDSRFKSGVHTAYENSIFWFFLKGKPINLEENDMITVILYIDDEIGGKKHKKIKKIKDN